jgi:hypothetical protein
MKVQIKNVRIFFIDDQEFSGFGIQARDQDGREYYLLDEHGDYRVMSYYKADSVVDRIKAANHMVSLDQWLVRTPYGTNAWMIDNMEDRQIEDERYAYH